MSRYFLAIDIGASSGRHILGSVENGKIVLEEVYRFWNGMDHVDGTLCWDVDRLFNEIIAGMKKCKEIGKIPVSVGIDTWGVDFVLLDKEDNIVGQTVGYRDHRTEGMDEEVYKIISEDDLYARTGIQKAIYNTIYQQWTWFRRHHHRHDPVRFRIRTFSFRHFRSRSCHFIFCKAFLFPKPEISRPGSFWNQSALWCRIKYYKYCR